MSTLLQRRTAARRHLLERKAGPAARLLAIAAEWRRRALGRAALARMSQRQLRDIGLTAADAARECAKPFWRN